MQEDWKNKCCSWVSDCLFCETAPSAVPEGTNIPEILCGLYVDSTRYTILEVTHGSNARLLISESCVNMTEI